MKKMFLLLCLMIGLAAAVDIQVVTVDNPYDHAATVGQWERNNYYRIQVRAFNNSAMVQSFNRIEANLDFDSAQLRYVGQTDSISGWTGTNFFIVTNGHIQYQRGANQGESAKTIPALGSLLLYEVLVQVRPTAAVQNTSMILDSDFTHILFATVNMTESLSPLTVTVVADVTPPVTRISPAANLHLAAPVNIVLDNDPNPNTNCADLREIRYTIDGTTPNLSSSVFNGGLMVPANTLRTIMWFGIDNTGNQEPVRSVQYRVDTNAPMISNLSTLPAQPAYVRRGSLYTIHFTASDDSALASVQVLVGNNPAVQISAAGDNYSYGYVVSETGDQVKTIRITATDHAGNQTVYTGLPLNIDNTPPTFNIISINPAHALHVGQQVQFVFSASEVLNMSAITVNIGQNSPAQFINEHNQTYHFQRTLDGTETSGWIMVYAQDRAGNIGFNLAGNNTVKISGYDLFNNYGETTTSMNIQY
jgi:hypothetical protein